LTGTGSFAIIVRKKEDPFMKKVIILSVVLMLACAASLFAAPPNMQEGNWEIVTSIKIEGVPFPMPPMKMTQCFTKKDLEDSSKTRPDAGGSGKKGDCEVKDLVETGKSATWKIVCKDGSTGTGEAAYQGSSFTTTMTMVDPSGGKSTTTMKAKRLGDCK
jgi:hypothetical protein